ncbi:MAG: hypothetical protein COX16_15160 [Deltaproteobacteria bacterium CG23_combo_of_CG06-09_8_20_14_all_51_20]|nr:MAG: hypothetical protein COX16_15160 [Deltaproteobacteria bacterium CG23_combo_of_CG06-09_8_20_14_all_51_20]PIW01654.1 MAG: hypothetical protein COW41_02005 [Deltaproteobacteria bacterium CG17_big_fil_post_rev_8_21_14_2_50_51_6]
MSPSDLIETITRRGFTMIPREENILVEPAGLPSDLREQVRESKAEIIRELILDIADSIILGNREQWNKKLG